MGAAQPVATPCCAGVGLREIDFRCHGFDRGTLDVPGFAFHPPQAVDSVVGFSAPRDQMWVTGSANAGPTEGRESDGIRR